MRFFFPDTPPLPLPPGHRFPADKYHRLVTKLSDEKSLGSAQILPSPLASRGDLCAVHCPAYVASVFDGSLGQPEQRRIGIPWSPTLLERSRATVGGTLAAARAAFDDGLSGQFAGGTHHAHRAFGSGFCVFNDIAVAISALRQDRPNLRAAVIDLDVHQGDGNAALMAGERDPGTCVVSVHGANNFPFRKVASDLDLPLPDHSTDIDYLAAVDIAVRAAEAHLPDIVFFISGVDPLIDDRLGRLDVSADGLAERDRRVLAWARDRSIPAVIVVGGGYADPISLTVDAYARTFVIARAVHGW